MKNLFKGKIATVGIILATLILAGVAVFTAIRLYQLRQQAVAPNVPSSIPRAQEVATRSSCSLSFTLVRPTIAPKCNVTPCSSDTQCPTNLVCYRPAPQSGGPSNMGACRNPQCLTSEDCVCPTVTATPTPTVRPTGNIPTPTATTTSSGTPNSCNGTCGSNSNCNSGLFCYQGYCRNTSCPSETDCSCPGTVTATPTGTQPSLPDAGTSLPTILGVSLGTLLIIGAILLAL